MEDDTILDSQDVNAIEDIMDAMDICDAHTIPCDDLNSVEEFVERIRLHLLKSQRNISRKQEIEEALLKASKDDEKKRKRLTEMMESLLHIIHKQGANVLEKKNSAFFEGLLRKEGTSVNLETDCAQRKAALESGECVILVAGESSAGKSSVLNLLFEQDVLPVHTKSSTSVITIVRYGRKARAEVIYKTDTPAAHFNLDEEGIKKLHAIAFMEKASERECHNIREVRVFLPLKLLQCGLVLVDSPGIGENEYLEKELMDFISRTKLNGFMYIIKTDNAGGVQEDRLLQLLKIVVSKQRSTSIMSGSGRSAETTFDPRAALFVCNRFDLIDSDQQEHVRQHAIDQLSNCWPSFDPAQVVFFSTDKSRRDVEADADYINDNYKLILEGLRDVVVTALEKRIKSSYKWIENVLKRSVYHLKTMVKRLDCSDKDLRNKSTLAKQKLEALKKKADAVVNNLKGNVDDKAVSLCNDLGEFIRSPRCKHCLLNNWESAELPNVEQGLGKWPWIKEKIATILYDRLSQLVQEWDRDTETITSIEEEMSTEIKYNLKLLEEELEQIEREIQEDTSSSSSDDIAALSTGRRRSRIPTGIRRCSMYKSRFLITEPKLPFRLAGHLIAPIAGVIDSIRNKAHVEEYMKGPVKVAEKKARDIYNDLIAQSDGNSEGISPFVELLLDRPREYIEALERKIPSLILSNQLLVNHFEQSIEAERTNQKDYEEMMTDIEGLRRSLMEYGEGYIFVEDFMKGEVQVQQISSDGNSVSVAFKVSDFLADSSQQDDVLRRRDIRGLWTITYGGILLRNGMERPIGIKVYLPSSGMKNTFQEVAKLRCLTAGSMNIAEFLGIHHADAPTPAFVFDGDLKSARRYLQSLFMVRRKAVCEILEETAEALEYLHRKGLVHMELTQDTVTIDEYGHVKLSGACIPRQAKLPMDTETTQTGEFVYLAPEVLRGKTYSAAADIYSFGLLILELTLPGLDLVFKRERKMTLYDFASKVNPELMLNLDHLLKEYTIKTRALITNCLNVDEYERPEMSLVVEYTEYLKDEEVVARLPNKSRSRRKVIRRGTTERSSSEEV